MDPIFFRSASDLRDWLERNHATTTELWVGFYKKSAAQNGITYPEAVDQALCYGWIDGIRKGIDASAYTNRFTPRKRRSTWSAVNIKRVGELTDLGLMHPSGLAAFNNRDPDRAGLYSFEASNRDLPEEYKEQFRANQPAWDFFQSQPPGYRKTASWWVISPKKEETRQKRLATLIEDSANARRLAAVTYSPDQESK
jgi:uncharacterized protein YdeI (YjbR/CyaY-like superfamily)